MQGKVTPLILQPCKINPPPPGQKVESRRLLGGGGGGLETSSVACGVNFLG
jgi:hypothetical protein